MDTINQHAHFSSELEPMSLENDLASAGVLPSQHFSNAPAVPLMNSSDVITCDAAEPEKETAARKKLKFSNRDRMPELEDWEQEHFPGKTKNDLTDAEKKERKRLRNKRSSKQCYAKKAEKNAKLVEDKKF